ncbi:methyltransferase domain-containing protein [Desulfovibrio sp. OttesenSCG-928-M16]|nr:methyltransferase domain-containing protein [Desulfovibrio sp. OttesenSCG-928-M16]
MKSSWIDFWDAKERMQGPFWDTYAAFFAEHVRAVIPFAHSDILLDLGCGNGKILSLLAPSVQAAYGLDTSPSLIKRCKSDYAHIQNMFFDTIPQQDYTNISSLDLPPFNIIICSSILQYYESPAHVKALLVDLKKIIAPNALLLFADMLLDYNILRDLAGSLYGGHYLRHLMV